MQGVFNRGNNWQCTTLIYSETMWSFVLWDQIQFTYHMDFLHFDKQIQAYIIFTSNEMSEFVGQHKGAFQKKSFIILGHW